MVAAQLKVVRRTRPILAPFAAEISGLLEFAVSHVSESRHGAPTFSPLVQICARQVHDRVAALALVDYYLAALHNQRDVMHDNVDVGERVAIDGDDVGKSSGNDASKIVRLVEQFRSYAGCRVDCFGWRHPALNQPFEFVGVLAKAGENGV